MHRIFLVLIILIVGLVWVTPVSAAGSVYVYYSGLADHVKQALTLVKGQQAFILTDDVTLASARAISRIN
jgi:hypothetical protein